MSSLVNKQNILDEQVLKEGRRIIEDQNARDEEVSDGDATSYELQFLHDLETGKEQVTKASGEIVRDSDKISD